MKVALVLAAVGAVVAQNLSGIPACATGCLSSAITAAGCQPSDQACQCGPTSSSIGALAATCILASCNAQQVNTVASVGAELCAEFSAGLSSTSSTPASASASTTSTNSASASTTPSSTSTAVVISTSTSQSSSAAAATTVTSTSVVGSNSTVTSHSPTAQSTNAAAAPIVAGVGALAAFLGVVAAL